MKYSATLLVAAVCSVFVCACAEREPVPVDAVQMDEENIETARAAWDAQDLPTPVCAAPLLAVVSPADFDRRAPLKSCVEQDSGLCAYAATDLDSYVHPVTFYVPDPELGARTLEIMTHEIFHVWYACTLGASDGDYHHRDARVWGKDGALRFVDDVAGVAWRAQPAY